jgi:WD40 repeat protein
MNIENIKLRRARIANVLISLVAIGAVALAVYAFELKREATDQTSLAYEKTIEAQLQEKRAVEQKNIADSSKEQVEEQRERALEFAKNALEQKEIAENEKRTAEERKQEALHALTEAQRQFEARVKAEREKVIADSLTRVQQELADQQRINAINEKQTSTKLKELAESQSIAKEAVELLNENHFDSSKSKALEAYQLNKINNGPKQNYDIYNALNLYWAKSIYYKNQFSIHKLPVHCITGIPNSNIIFTADESGMLYECIFKNNTLQKMVSYPVKEEVRALSVSPDDNRLIAITAMENGIIFNVTSSGLSATTNFKFPGTGRIVRFSSAENFIVVSSKGIGNYSIKNITKQEFLNYDGITSFTIEKNGKLYIASGNEVKVYKEWNNLMNGISTATLKFDSKVTSLAINDNEKYLGVGTYNGSVYITNLQTDIVLWRRTLHSSSVNDLKFALVDKDIIQLASASADHTIKLINVTAILQNNSAEDVITLKGHNNWIYALFYTSDGEWLFSAGEDSKVIAWKPSMNDLYQTLKQ